MILIPLLVLSIGAIFAGILFEGSFIGAESMEFWRGAVASIGGARRACFAAASAVSAKRAAIAANVTQAGGPQRRIAPVDCAAVSRFTMPCPG